MAFMWKAARQREEEIFHLLFTLPVLATARAAPGCTQEPAAPSLFPCGLFDPSSAVAQIRTH